MFWSKSYSFMIDNTKKCKIKIFLDKDIVEWPTNMYYISISCILILKPWGKIARLLSIFQILIHFRTFVINVGIYVQNCISICQTSIKIICQYMSQAVIIIYHGTFNNRVSLRIFTWVIWVQSVIHRKTFSKLVLLKCHAFKSCSLVFVSKLFLISHKMLLFIKTPIRLGDLHKL